MEVKALKEKSRVEQFERIRRDHREKGLSVRAPAARHRVHRRTVRQTLADAVPPAPKAPVRVPTPKPADATSSASSKPSGTRSPSNPPSRSHSPRAITDHPTPSRVTDPCPGNEPGHRSFVSALVPLAGRAFRAENRVWSPADAVFL
jgi:hypothetical protein